MQCLPMTWTNNGVTKSPFADTIFGQDPPFTDKLISLCLTHRLSIQTRAASDGDLVSCLAIREKLPCFVKNVDFLQRHV